jgi:hypothetical protein
MSALHGIQEGMQCDDSIVTFKLFYVSKIAPSISSR